MPLKYKARKYSELFKDAPHVPAPAEWRPYVPKPLPGNWQARIDAYRAIPSLKY